MSAEPDPDGPRPLRRGWWFGLAAASLLALGAGSYLVGSSLAVVEVSLVGANAPIDAGATDPGDIQAHSSPSVSRNPLDPANLVVANRIDLPSYSCALHMSIDGGATWGATDVPFPKGEERPPRCYAPDVAFGADGTLYVSFVTLAGIGNSPNAVWVSRSDDGGRTLSAPIEAPPFGPLAFQVRLTADPERPGRLYLSWLEAEAVGVFSFPDDGNPVHVARSDDGAETWEADVRASDPARDKVVAPSTAVGSDGTLYLSYLDLGGDSLDYHGGHQGQGGEPYPGPWTLVVARSSDAGKTWHQSVVDDRVVPIERFIVFLPPSPSLAVDADDGRVYVAFHDGGSGDADVLLWVSSDGGEGFAAPVRVNDSASGDGTAQYLPEVAVAPDGRVDVLYYDRRRDREDVMNEASLQSSFDSGKSFTPRLAVSDRSFDSRIGPGSTRDLTDLGSRLALLATEDAALAIWTDTRSGVEASGKQNLARAVVSISPASPWRGPVRTAGVVAATIGALVLAGGVAGWARLRRRRRAALASPTEEDVAPPVAH